jgi:hypothetical protein
MTHEELRKDEIVSKSRYYAGISSVATENHENSQTG